MNNKLQQMFYAHYHVQVCDLMYSTIYHYKYINILNIIYMYILTYIPYYTLQIFTAQQKYEY